MSKLETCQVRAGFVGSAARRTAVLGREKGEAVAIVVAERSVRKAEKGEEKCIVVSWLVVFWSYR
jgi:hypothetical protein